MPPRFNGTLAVIGAAKPASQSAAEELASRPEGEELALALAL
jgi:hypothetical protein